MEPSGLPKRVLLRLQVVQVSLLRIGKSPSRNLLRGVRLGLGFPFQFGLPYWANALTIKATWLHLLWNLPDFLRQPGSSRNLLELSITFRTFRSFQNLPYMPETIPDTPETIRDLSEPFRDHPRHSRNPSLYYRHSHNIRDISEQLSEPHFFISSIHTQSKMLLSFKCVTRRVRIYADMYRNTFRYNEH